MKLLKKIDHQWIVKLPVLFVYLLFFTVQIFFNFDTGSNSIISSSGSLSIQHSSVHSQNIKQGSSKAQVKVKIRLNKRYTPSSFPLLTVISVELPVINLSPEKTDLYKSVFYHSTILSAQLLRGPPAIA